VYDVTDFLASHPGGAGVLAGLGGKDATDFFDELHRPEILVEIASEYKIGVIGDAPAAAAAEAPAEAEATVSAEQWREVQAPTTAGKNQVVSLAEVAKHTEYDDCWLVVEDKVYDVSKFMEDHPGGPKPLVLYGGKDATEEFTMIHHPDIIKAYGELYRVGVLEGTEAAAAALAAEGGVAADVVEAPAGVPAGGDGGYYTLEEVAQHSAKDDCWVIVHDGTQSRLGAFCAWCTRH
jgi:cytochrome b involved in lipid metabolism